jgi:hypothetical protein
MKTAIEIKPFDHAAWINKLKSYKHELVNLEESLAELASKSKKREDLARIEHFQNQFIVQRSNVNDVLHALKMDEREHVFRLLHKSKTDKQPVSEHNPRELAKIFEKTMGELKEEFSSFASKHKYV